jgi:hypothetical protein
MAPKTQQRTEEHLRFVHAALHPQPPPPAQRPALLKHLYTTLTRLWSLPWENSNKDIFWRLICNGVSGAGGHDICPQGACPCGWQMSDAARRGNQGHLLRSHYFWDCSAATAVRQQLTACLPAAPSRHHLWLMQPPPGVTHPGIWQVTCLAALSAMEHGRKRLWLHHLNPPDPDPAQPDAPPLPATTTAATAATMYFWDSLADFCTTPAAATATVPAWTPVPPGHPFIQLDTDTSSLQLTAPPH